VFDLGGAPAARAQCSVLAKWMRARTTLAYARGHHSSALVDVADLFARAAYKAEERGNAQ
jgi:hypothetical protein